MPNNPNNTKHNKKEMIKALKKSLGIVTSACKSTGVSRTTHYQWLKDDKDYKDEVNNITEEAIDYAETSLFSQIEDKNTTATIFFLKTKAKHRGYNEHVDVKDEETNITVNIYGMNEEAI